METLPTAPLAPAAIPATLLYSSGQPSIDERFQQLLNEGLSFTLFTVPFTTPLRFTGAVTVEPLEGRVRYSGEAALGAPFHLTVPLVVTIDTRLNFSVQFKLPRVDALVEQSVRPAVPQHWPVIESVAMPYLRQFQDMTVAIANAEVEDAQLGTITPGFNLFVPMSLSRLEPLRSLDKRFKVLDLSGVRMDVHFGCDPTSFDFVIEGEVTLDVELGTPRVVLNTLGLKVKKDTHDLIAAGTCRFTVSIGQETLTFEGGLEGQTGGSVSLWGAMKANDGEWREPFGVQGVSISSLGAQIGVAALPPYIAVGFRGDVRVGGNKLDANMGLLFDPAAVERCVVDIHSKSGLGLTSLLRAVLSPELKLRELFDASIKDVHLYLSPTGGSIAGRDYPAGLGVEGTLDLWGWKARVSGGLDHATGGTLAGSMDRILLELGGQPILELSNGQKSGPTLELNLTTQKQGGSIHGRVTTLGTSYQSLDAEFDEDGFELQLQKKSFGIYGGALLSFDRGEFYLEARTGFDYHYDLKSGSVRIPSPVSSITLKMSAAIELKMKNGVVSQSLRCGYNAFGMSQSLGPAKWELALEDVDDLCQATAKLFTKQIDGFIRGQLGTASTAVIQWLETNVTAVGEEAAMLLRNAGADVDVIATGLVNVYGMSTKSAVKALKVSAQESARILKETFKWSTEETGKFLKNTLKCSQKEVEKALKGAGYATKEIEKFAKDTWDSVSGFVSGLF